MNDELIKKYNGWQFGQRFIPRHQRQAQKEFTVEDVGLRSLLFSVSSEKPYYRWFLDANEVLVHEERAIDLEWLASGRAPFLFNHDRDFYLGIIEKSYLADSQLFAEVRFKERGQAGEVYQDVKDGLLSGATSIGYEIHDLEIYEEKEANEIRVTSWHPLEASLVTLPADNSVGLQGESEEKQHFTGSHRSVAPPEEETPEEEEQITNIEEKKVPDPNQEFTEQGASPEEVRQKERERQSGIRFMCQKFGLGEQHEREWIDNGSSLEAVSKKAQELSAEPKPAAAPSGFLSQKEKKRYNLTKVLRVQSGMSKEDIGFEKEVSDYIAKSIGKDPIELEGLYFPIREMDFKRDTGLNTGSIATGGATIDTELDVSNFTQALLNQTLCFQMGVRLMSGLSGPVDIPIESDTPQVFWVGEGEPIPEAQSSFELASLRWKEIASITPITKRMMAQSSLDMEAYIRDILVRKIAIGIDDAILNGSGTQNQPLGLLNYPGLLLGNIGTDGGEIGWEHIVDLQTALGEKNAKRMGSGYLTNPKVEGMLRKTQKFAGEGFEILEAEADTATGLTQLAGYPLGCTNQVPSTFKKGSSGKVLSALIFAYWPDIIAGEFGTMEVLANPFGRGFYNNMVDIKATMGFDVTFVRDGTSFAAYKDVNAPGANFSRQGKK